jgi:hypothetical protein
MPSGLLYISSVRETETICQLNLSLCFAMHVFIDHFAVGSKMIDGNEGGVFIRVELSLRFLGAGRLDYPPTMLYNGYIKLVDCELTAC